MTSYLGIDGGGTKTLCLLVDEEGRKLGSCRFEGISHKQIGTANVYGNVLEAAEHLLHDAGRQDNDVYTVIGVPCFGEDADADQELLRLFGQWPYGKVRLVNDVEIAWAGALSMKEGIHLVAGTGSIALGVNDAGESRRCGGWSEYLDEGAGTWLGKKAIEAFTKQADGRIKETGIHSAFQAMFPGKDDLTIMGLLEQKYYPYRDRLASLQKLLSDCAKQGDPEACRIYEEAAYELSLMVKALYRNLHFQKQIDVSYTGGIFQNGEIILKPLERELSGLPVILKKPDHEPVCGAVLMAAGMHSDEAYRTILARIDEADL